MTYYSEYVSTIYLRLLLLLCIASVLLVLVDDYPERIIGTAVVD